MGGIKMNLKGKVALISGAAGGIGRCITEKFDKMAVHLILTDIIPLDDILAKIGKMGNKGIGVKGNLTLEGDVDYILKVAIDTFGRIDILVNNAGGSYAQDGRTPTKLLEDLTIEEWDFVLNNNLKSVFLLTRAVIPHMKKQHYGRIVSISSMVGRVGVPYSTIPYSTAKAGIIGFTRILAYQLGPTGITVNAVAPGNILSGPRLEKVWEERKKTGIGDQIINSIALKRLGTPGEVANVVAFLASDESSYITGSTIDVLGGAYTL
jgi:3-oxoacyl-[acyl-carrier protein] reductase